MYKINIKDLEKITKGKILSGDENNTITNITIDSREVTPTSLFIPIIGESHDGHNFLQTSYDNGCRTFLIDKNHDYNQKGINLIEVEDTKQAFADIAKYYKEQFNIPFIGITGSVGKTTTKDMTASVLKEKYKTLKNQGNLNNEIGVPKTLLNLTSQYEVAVIEMGASSKGEIKFLADIVHPRVAIITYIGVSHIEFFKTQQGIFEGKMEITSNFNENNTLIVNGDNEFLKTLKEKKLPYQLITYGFNEYNDLYCKSYKIENNETKFICKYNNIEEEFTIPNPAKHNIYNAMAAILVGILMKVDIEDIKKGLKNYESSANRMEIFTKNNITIINDSYNANTDSMLGTISTLTNYKTRKVAILGDMLEMGDSSKQEHEKVGQFVKEKNIDILITVGNDSKYIRDKAIELGFPEENSYHFENYEELIKEIDNLLIKEDTVLLKGSNGIKLYEIANYLKNK